MSKSAIVIGAGFGGLAAAIRLQSAGWKVKLIEQRDQVGGRAYQFKEDGYTFDMGPSLVTVPDLIEGVFEAADRRMEDYIDLVPLDPFYRIYFHDGTHIDYSGDSEKMKEQMRQFNSNDADRYDEFVDATRPVYDAVIKEGLGRRPFDTVSKLLTFIPMALRLGAHKRVSTFARDFFEDFRHHFLFSFHPLFIGGNPFRVPSVYIMIPYLEKVGGVWFSQGGMYSIVEAFAKVFTEIGGQIITSTPVERIETSEGAVSGVFAGGDFHEADIVVSNADTAFTYNKLLEDVPKKRWTPRRIERLEQSMSCFLLYLGVRKQYKALEHHTLILSQRYEQLITDIFDRKILADDFSMYLHAPTRTDAGMAPPGCESLYVLVPVPNLKSGVDWEEMRPVMTDRVIDFLENWGLDGLRENTEVLRTFTPLDFQSELSAWDGSAFGIEPRLTQTAIFRPHNRSEDIRNLYLVGAGTHPGAGVPGGSSLGRSHGLRGGRGPRYLAFGEWQLHGDTLTTDRKAGPGGADLQAPPSADSDTGRRILSALVKERSLLAALEEMRKLLGDVFSVNAPGFTPIFVAGPKACRSVLVKERHKVAWRNEGDAVTKLLRHGLLVEDDDDHARLRACMDPTLKRPRAVSNLSKMAAEVAFVCDQWRDGEVVDMLDEMRKISLLVLMRASFHWDFRGDMDRLWGPILTSIKYISPGPWLVWPSMPRLGFKRDLAELDEYLYQMIRTRRREMEESQAPPDPSDLLGALIAEGLDDDLARDQLLTMLIAGHDTSTALLAWVFYLLGSHPEKMAAAREEVDRVLGGDKITPDHLPQLDYLDWTAKEALRLYPPIHVGNRRTREPMDVGGCPIKRGSRLMYSIYLTHRHPDYWEDSAAFKPERFGPDGPKRQSFTFLPFGGGPRNCIGAAFAQVQSKVVLAHVLVNFSLELKEKMVRPYMGATLEPRPGVRMRIATR